MDVNEIIEKVKDILAKEIPDRKIYDKDVANVLGMSKESLSHIKKNNRIPFEQISIFCAKRKISINWVLFEQLPKTLEEETQKYIQVKYFANICASAGGGNFNYEEDFQYLDIDKKLIENFYHTKVDNSSLLALNVMGDSMEPTLHDKDIILFDKDLVDVAKGGIFVVSTSAGLFVKRVGIKTDGSLELISDNKSYNSEIISVDEQDFISVLGKVVSRVSCL